MMSIYFCSVVEAFYEIIRNFSEHNWSDIKFLRNSLFLIMLLCVPCHVYTLSLKQTQRKKSRVVRSGDLVGQYIPLNEKPNQSHHERRSTLSRVLIVLGGPSFF